MTPDAVGLGSLAWRNVEGRLVASVGGVDTLYVERDRGYWFWVTVRASHDWQTGYATAAEAKAAAEAWFALAGGPGR